MIGGVSELKVLDLSEESLHLGLHCGVGLIGGSEFGGVLCGCDCAFVLVNLVARHHLIHDGVGVAESQFFNCSSGFSEFKLCLKLSHVLYAWLVHFNARMPSLKISCLLRITRARFIV